MSVIHYAFLLAAYFMHLSCLVTLGDVGIFFPFYYHDPFGKDSSMIFNENHENEVYKLLPCAMNYLFCFSEGVPGLNRLNDVNFSFYICFSSFL